MKRYLVLMSVGFAAYAATLIASQTLLVHGSESTTVLVLLSLAPMLLSDLHLRRHHCQHFAAGRDAAQTSA